LLLYYITDRKQFPGDEREHRERLLANIAEAVRCGVDYVQLREKDVATRDLETLAREAMERIRASGGKTRLLINSRTDVALAAGADGVHLRSKDVLPEEVRKIWRAGNGSAQPVVAVSCHTEADVLAAAKSDADFAVFGPVFGKPVVEKKDAREIGHTGLDLLQAVCKIGIPVFALGGVTAENAAMCMDAGVKGIAGIRLFQESALSQVVAKIRR
jgi:thiamine-phosphate pyrophosphorylase